MKVIFYSAVLFLLATSFSSCEKDDICPESTQTTSLMVVRFFDINNPSVAKNVTALKVRAQGVTDSVAVFNAVSSIELPLSVTADAVTYIFELNSDNQNADQDLVTFNYSRNDVFVSRACGFKTVFILDAETPFELTAGSDSIWIQEIAIVQSNIEHENEAHVNIYF